MGSAEGNESSPDDKRSSRLSRLKRLKAKKAESERNNRKDLFDDYKKQKLQSINRKKIEKLKENAEEEVNKLDHEERGEDYERQRNLDWSIKDWEEWEKKTGKQRPRQVGFDNWSQLAASSYEKEISKLQVDKDDYNEKKQVLMRKYNITEPKDVRNIIDLKSEVKSSDIDKLVQNINETNDRRMKRRRDHDSEHDVSSYINEKNKQFNMKLNRQYDKD